MIFHEGALITQRDTDRPRAYLSRFVGLAPDGVSFVGDHLWKAVGFLGDYDHETEFWTGLLMREVDLREAALWGYA
jgi:hypothetical protein